MWKRLRGKDNTNIGSPKLIETTYDEKSLGNLPDVSNAQSPTSPQDTLGQLPQLPYRSLAPEDRLGPPGAGDSRTSKVASSVYSQPGLDDGLAPPDVPRGRQVASSVYSQPTPETQYAGPDVSPPSTPGGAEDGGVSPIADGGNDWRTLPKQHQQTNSHIPVLRKGPGIPTSPPQGRPQGPRQNPTTRSSSGGSGTKWDKYSGEPTTKPGGLTGNFNPTKFESGAGGQSRKLDPERYRFGGNDNQKASVAERASRFATANKGLSIETKPRAQPSQPWDKATGRSAIVPQVKDTPAAAPLAIPPRSSKRPSPANSPQNNSPASATRRVQPDAETWKVPTVREVPNSRDGQDSSLSDSSTIRPTVPLKAGRNSPPRVVASPSTATQNQGTGYPSPVSPGSGGEEKHTRSINDKVMSAPQGSTINNPARQHKHTSSGKSSSNPKSSSESRRTNDPAALDSRFSWTTYNTDTTYQGHSPPPSPPPPMPTMLATARPTPAGPSGTAPHLMSRGRPLPPRTSSSDSRHSNPLRSNPVTLPPVSPVTRISAVARKPAPSIISTTSTMTTDKALPPPPHALSTKDHIAALQAQRDDLAHRRANVERLVRDLTRAEAATRNPLVTSYWERRQIEKKVESLKGELEDIGIQEHEVGLKLHRAWRRREKDDPDALGTALWVRRVTAGEL